MSGDLFLFVSRDRIRAKVLHFDGTGLCLYVKSRSAGDSRPCGGTRPRAR